MVLHGDSLIFCAMLRNLELTGYYFSEVTINRLREKVREYEDKIEETAKVCDNVIKTNLKSYPV